MPGDVEGICIDLTGDRLKDAERHIACNRCGQVPGKACKRPTGQKVNRPHKERVKTLMEIVPEEFYAAAAP